MKRIIFIALMLASFASFAQPQFGGQVGGYDNSGTKKFLMFNGNAGKFWDSTANVYNLAQKLKLDSLYTKINSSIAVTMAGHDSTTDSRIGVKLLQNPTIANTSFGISGTLPAFASTPTVNIGTTGTIPVSGTFWQATQPVSLASVPSHAVTNAGTFAVQSTNQANSGVDIGDVTINNASGGSAVNIQDGGNSITVDGSLTNISGTISLPTGASTSALQTSGNTTLSNIQTSVDNISTWVDNNIMARPTDSTLTPYNGFNAYATVCNMSPSLTSGKSGSLYLTQRGGLMVTLIDMAGNYVDASAGGGGGGGGGSSITALRDSSSSNTDFTMTSISSLASSATVGWQSDRVSNLTNKAIDYRINVRLSMANTSPASDKAVYVFLIPWFTTDGGTTWYGNSLGTTTAPTGSVGAMTIANPHNLLLLGVLSYTTADMVLNGTFITSNAWGDNPPDGFSIGIINYSGAALDATSGANNLISYKSIYKTNR